MALVRWLVSYLLFAVAACGVNSSQEPSDSTVHGCSVDGDCDPNQLCVFGLCNVSCSSAGDCKNGGACLDTGRGSACLRLQDNACVSTSNCPARTSCVAGRCLTDCENDGGQCLSGASGAGAAAQARACAPGSVSCDGLSVVSCGSDARTTVEDTCVFACSEGACVGSCTPDTWRCAGQERQRCDAMGEWHTVETCVANCTAAACTETCVDDALECSTSDVMRCVQGRFVTQTTCGFICDGGSCAGECQPGSRRCSNGSASTCSLNGMWLESTACANACVDGSCTGACSPGEQRCAGTSGHQQCNELGQWSETVSCGDRACTLGSCSGDCSGDCAGAAGSAGMVSSECAPSVRRCDPANSTRFQTCTDRGAWDMGQACGAGISCAGQGRCNAAAVGCKAGQSPDWYSPVSAGGNPTLDDSRWGDTPVSEFISTFGFQPGGYTLILDRGAQQLAITVRITLGPSEVPAPSDYVFFGIAPDAADAATAHSVIMPLIDMPPASGPAPLSNIDASLLQGGRWQSDPSNTWVQHASVWRGGPNDGYSWVVSFKVDLAAMALDPSESFRVAIAAHAEGAPRDMTTPGDASVLTALPNAWAQALSDSATCVAHVTLQ